MREVSEVGVSSFEGTKTAMEDDMVVRVSCCVKGLGECGVYGGICGAYDTKVRFDIILLSDLMFHHRARPIHYYPKL